MTNVRRVGAVDAGGAGSVMVVSPTEKVGAKCGVVILGGGGDGGFCGHLFVFLKCFPSPNFTATRTCCFSLFQFSGVMTGCEQKRFICLRPSLRLSARRRRVRFFSFSLDVCVCFVFFCLLSASLFFEGTVA